MRENNYKGKFEEKLNSWSLGQVAFWNLFYFGRNKQTGFIFLTYQTRNNPLYENHQKTQINYKKKVENSDRNSLSFHSFSADSVFILSDFHKNMFA